MATTIINKWYKKGLLALFVLVLSGGAYVWYLYNREYADTDKVKAEYTVNAVDFIKEFQANNGLANKKYSEKIIVVNGTVSGIKNADTTANIIMTDTTSGAYIIFAFQQQHLAEAKQMKEGDTVSIKGSCSGGNYSEILQTVSINFKRCSVNK